VTASIVVLVVLAVATVLGLWWRSRNGAFRAVEPDAAAPSLAGRLGLEPGARLTFVQFSSEVCHPCRQTARVLSTLAEREDGVVHVELDVDEQPDLVRELHVLRTPTVLTLDREGHIVGRLSGSVTAAQARATLDAASAAAA